MPGPLDSPEVLIEKDNSKHLSESVKLKSLEIEVMMVHFKLIWLLNNFFSTYHCLYDNCIIFALLC